MESVVCPQCQASVPAGSTFCGKCGARIAPPQLDPTTRLTVPPAPPEATSQASAPPIYPYDAQYGGPVTQRFPGPSTALPPTEPLTWGTPPAPPIMPQGNLPRKRRRGLGILLLLLLVLLLGGGGYLAFNALRPSANPGGQNGASSQNGSSARSLPAINRQAIYAGATFTIRSADKASSFPGYNKHNTSDDVVKVQAQINNQTPNQISLLDTIHLLAPDGSSTGPSITTANDALASYYNSGTNAVGAWYFEVNHDQSGVGAYKIVLGAADEAQETIPFTGAYDASVWQWVTKPIGKSVTYKLDTGTVVGTVAKVSTGIWTPGHQAPQGMRFVLTDMLVANQSALPVLVTGNAIKLQAPGGIPQSPSTSYGYFINDSLAAGENKDEGYASFVVPPDKGDFILFFYNADGTVAGQVDLGVL